MAHAGPTVGKATVYLLLSVTNHRNLVAATFPRYASEERTDAPAAAAVGIEDQAEMLHCAASQGILSFVLALLANGRFSCDLPDRFGRTPIHWAAEQGHRNVVLALLRAGACVDPRSQRNATPIMLAASRGHTDAVGVLLQYRAGESDCRPLDRNLHGIGHWRSTALHCAAAGGHVRVVEALLDAGFDRGQHNEACLTPAEVSARQSHSTSPAVTRLLLPTSDMGGKLAYDYVSMAVEDVVTVSGLVNGGAFLDWQNVNGETPLHRAVHFRHVTTSRVLLQGGADPNIRDRRGTSPLHVAACTGRWEIVVDLVRVGADVDSRRVGGQSPLHMAVVNNRVNIVSLLLSAGASTEHRDDMHGQTPLSWASKGCLAPIVRVLVEAGADIESRSSAGLTPLHWACRFVDAESVEALLNAGADPGAVDQAAANDAVAKSSSRSGTIASMPVAIDVIGLGYPLDRMEDSRSPFSMRLAARRFELGSVERITSALQAAKQECSWRRRGWLVILANRWVAKNLAPGVRDERAAICRRCVGNFHSAVMQSRYVDTGVEQPPCAHQKAAASYRVDANTNNDSSNSQHAQERARTVRRVGMTTRSASRRQGQISLPELVGALFELAAVELGVFRRVVLFI